MALHLAQNKLASKLINEYAYFMTTTYGVSGRFDFD